MASPEIYQEGKESRGGFWRFLAIAVTIGTVIFLVADALDLQLSKG